MRKHEHMRWEAGNTELLQWRVHDSPGLVLQKFRLFCIKSSDLRAFLYSVTLPSAVYRGFKVSACTGRLNKT